MKKLHIWVFYISIFICIMPLFGQKEMNSNVSDSLEIRKNNALSLRFGIDLYRITLSRISDDFNGFEAVTDLKVGKDLFIAMEIGSIETTNKLSN